MSGELHVISGPLGRFLSVDALRWAIEQRKGGRQVIYLSADLPAREIIALKEILGTPDDIQVLDIAGVRIDQWKALRDWIALPGAAYVIDSLNALRPNWSSPMGRDGKFSSSQVQAMREATQRIAHHASIVGAVVAITVYKDWLGWPYVEIMPPFIQVHVRQTQGWKLIGKWDMIRVECVRCETFTFVPFNPEAPIAHAIGEAMKQKWANGMCPQCKKTVPRIIP